MMKVRHCLLAALVLAAPGGARAATNLVLNGNFATTSTASANGNFELTASGTYGTVANWTTANSPTNTNPYNILFTAAAGPNTAESTTTAGSPSNSASGAYGQYSTNANNSGSNEYIDAAFNMTSPAGGNFMALDGDPNVNGYLQQTVTGLTVGALYELDFYWAVAELVTRQAANGLTDYLKVAFGNSTAQTSTVAIADQGFSGWIKQTYFFAATSTSQTLSFLSVGTPSGTPPLALLDGVSLVATPEPSTLAVLGVAIGGMAMARRRKKAAAAAA